MRLIACLILAAIALGISAGCRPMGQATLHEPRPEPAVVSTREVPPPMTLEMITAMGGSAPLRFESPAYAALQQNSYTEVGADMDPCVCPDGRSIAFSSTRHATSADIYLKKVDGQTVTRLSCGPGNKIQPAFSPDGQFIAYASDHRGNWDIYIMTADGQRPFQLTDSLSHDVHPSWSPDGSRLCYSSFNHRSGTWEIWLVDVANPARRKYLTNGLFPVWSPDPRANRLAFQMSRQRDNRLFSVWTVDLVDDEARMLTEIVPASEDTAAISPNWSPDGSHLAYATVRVAPLQPVQPASDPRVQAPAAPQAAIAEVAAPAAKAVSDIWITTLNGATRVNLTADELADWSPFWASDGRIYFTSSRGGVENIWSLKPLDTTLMQATRVRPERLGRRLPEAAGGSAPTETATSDIRANKADM